MPATHAELPSSGPALAWPATRRRLRRLSLRWGSVTLFGLACIAGIVALVSIEHSVRDGQRIALAIALPMLVVAATVACIFGAGVLVHLRTVRSVLGRAPWQVVTAAATTRGTIALSDSRARPIAVVTLMRVPGMARADRIASVSQLWFAANSAGRGVLAIPGGASFSRVRVQTFDFAGRTTAPAPNSERPHSERVPAASRFRRAVAFVLDWALHIGVGVTVAVVTAGTPLLLQLSGGRIRVAWWGIAAWIAASFVDRVVIQGLCATTVGKALLGLRVAHRRTGLRPSTARLALMWLLHVYLAAMSPLMLLGGDPPGPSNLGDYFPTAVRRATPPAADR